MNCLFWPLLSCFSALLLLFINFIILTNLINNFKLLNTYMTILCFGVVLSMFSNIKRARN